jgi:glycosyltransferase involved in cell wall biosynthesis
MDDMKRICITPRVEGTGGMASFRLKFEQGLRARGIEFTHDLSAPSDAVLVLAGTRNLLPLWRARRRGIRIAQRLDGINWVHRVRWTGARYHLRAVYGNFVLSFIRARLAHRVIYQSQFIRRWWDDWYGIAPVPAEVILNGVDLAQYTPDGPHERPTDRYRLLVMEGSLAGGLNAGLFHAVEFAGLLSARFPMEVIVAGRVDRATQEKIESNSRVPVRFLGVLPREQIPRLARSSHLLYSAEINPPCPNSVIEALACGLPVVGFENGSLTELVTGDAGRVVPYGGDPWKMEKPDLPALAEAAVEILNDQPRFRRAARARAESALGLDEMVKDYLRVLFGG